MNHQLWSIPSGQGKSRILATIALILLLTASTAKVHIVFDSWHLMDRDVKEFLPWFEFQDVAHCLEFHVGLDFVCDTNDIILVDEADDIILSDPAKFQDKNKANRCVCLTATPDNDDKLGVEREVLKHLGFTFLNGQPLGQVPDSSLALNSIESIPFSLDAELTLYIKGRLDEQAVLLYCSLKFLELL